MRLVKEDVQKFCDDHGYSLRSFNMAGNKGRKHGRIVIQAGAHKITVGVAGTPKGGIQSTRKMVISHLRAKIMRAESGIHRGA